MALFASWAAYRLDRLLTGPPLWCPHNSFVSKHNNAILIPCSHRIRLHQMWGDVWPPTLVFVLIFIGAYRLKSMQAQSTGNRSNEKSRECTIPTTGSKCIHYNSICKHQNIGRGRTQGTHTTRKHEKVENHSLASMSTTTFVVFYKTKLSANNWERRGLCQART